MNRSPTHVTQITDSSESEERTELELVLKLVALGPDLPCRWR